MTIKKHKIVIFSISLIVALFGLVLAFVCLNKPTYELEYQYSEGKDSIGYIGNGKYQMWHINGVDVLTVKQGIKLSYKEDVTFFSPTVLEDEYDHYFDYYGNIYYYAADGYAVVYAENNLCKVFLTNENVLKIEEENLMYLDSFEEFTEKEQRELKKLKKPWYR